MTSPAGLDPPLTIIDVGVRGGVDATWTPLLPHLRVYGFDADPAECARLTAEQGSAQVQFVPLALAAAPGTMELHVTADSQCSSLYPPDERIIELYRALAGTEPIRRQPLVVDTLDNWADREHVTEVSFLKLDTQGGDLDVLRGATRTLRTVWALKVEVEFNPIYREQPLFSDVDAFLREQSFVLWRLANLCHYTLANHDERAPFPDSQVFASVAGDGLTVDFVGGTGRLFWADAFYVRRELADGRRPPDPAAATRASCVLATLGFADLAATCK